MKFRALVVIFLAVIAYGVLYHDLPCWAQVWDKSFSCWIEADTEQLHREQAEWRKAHPSRSKGRER